MRLISKLKTIRNKITSKYAEFVNDLGYLIYFGHHKCATKWIQGIMVNLIHEQGIKTAIADSPQQFNRDITGFMDEKNLGFLAFVNANSSFVPKGKQIKGFHVIRDPRDVAVSAYFSHLYSHSVSNWPQLAKHREKIRKLPLGGGLLLDMEFNSFVFDCMERWDYSNPNILELKMEDIIENPAEKFKQILVFLGLMHNENAKEKQRWYHINDDTLEYHLNQMSFEKLSDGRQKGHENVYSHYRKGQPGDWVNYFSDVHVKYFENQYTGLIEKLGYAPFQ